MVNGSWLKGARLGPLPGSLLSHEPCTEPLIIDFALLCEIVPQCVPTANLVWALALGAALRLQSQHEKCGVDALTFGCATPLINAQPPVLCNSHLRLHDYMNTSYHRSSSNPQLRKTHPLCYRGCRHAPN